MFRILVIASFLIIGASVQANPIEILLDDTTLGEGVTVGESVSAGGVTLSFTSAVATDGSNSAGVDDFGILFGTDVTSNDVVSLGIFFNVDVIITEYMIGSREDVPAGIFFTISGIEGTSGQNSVPSFDGFTEQEITLAFVPGELSVLKAGETYTITHNLLDATNHDPLFNLESLFVTLAEPSPAEVFDAIVASSGLGGDDALPTATPFNDGVENLLKYAFNMNLAGPDSHQMQPGGSSGLPGGGLVEESGQTYWRIEYVRRKNSGLIYTPQKSSTLGQDSFVPMSGAESVADILGAPDWERVTIDEPCDPATEDRCFNRVRVELP